MIGLRISREQLNLSRRNSAHWSDIIPVHHVSPLGAITPGADPRMAGMRLAHALV